MLKTSNASVTEVGQDIQRLHHLSVTELYSIPARTVAEIQLSALRTRFSSLVGKVGMLGRLAEEQKIQGLETIEAAAPLLFPHSYYKSYSASVLETGKFDRLTRWLSGLTSRDLSGVRLDACETIDDWIDALDTQTDIRLIHSSGTTGKLSFIPRSNIENARAVQGFRRVYEGFGDEPNACLTGLEACPAIIPTYRKGAMGLSRLMQHLAKYLYGGDEGMVIALSDGRLSADMLSLAGRIRLAETKGDAGRLQISSKLLKRREAFLREQEGIPARRQAFFEEVGQRLRGRRVILTGNWVMQFEVASEALKKGLEGLFSPDSFLYVAGGTKGRALPEGYQELIKRVLGLRTIRQGYGMSEMPQMCPACPQGHYHLQPYIVPFVLDPNTGTPVPRSGIHTGRFGFVDLMAETYWGGFLSGDEVTINWGDRDPCVCGRVGPFLHDQVRRLSEREGGDDKITCAGAPEAHDKALSFLTDLG